MIIVFNGPPGSGKDEACLFFEKKGFIHLSFKEQLFIETIKYFGVSKEWFMAGYNVRSEKEKPVNELNGMSRRDAMIHVSENIIKPKHGKDYFGAVTAKNLKPYEDYCFSDGGFREEIEPIINTVGAEELCVVQLTRDGCDFSSDSRRYLDGELAEQFIINRKTEISKSHILSGKFPIRTYRIHNNGTVEQFREALQKIYEKEQDVEQDTEKEASILRESI